MEANPMPSVPDSGSADHDDALPRPVPPPSTEAAVLALVERFGPIGWQLFHPCVGWWEAFRQDGTGSRTIVASTVTALYAKLARVQAPETGESGPYTDDVARYLAYLSSVTGTGQ
jgi:hypothetical protein